MLRELQKHLDKSLDSKINSATAVWASKDDMLRAKTLYVTLEANWDAGLEGCAAEHPDAASCSL